MDIYNNHKRLFGAALILFIGLTMFAAVLPALDSQNNNAPLPDSKPLTNKEITGKGIFIREGCIACHDAIFEVLASAPNRRLTSHQYVVTHRARLPDHRAGQHQS